MTARGHPQEEQDMALFKKTQVTRSLPGMAAVAFMLGMQPGIGLAAVVASSLPASRSVQVGTPATAFGTIINTDTTSPATGCGIGLVSSVAADFAYQTTDPATNALTGTANTPVNIPAGASQSYVFALTPTADFAPTDIQLNYDCNNTDSAPIFTVAQYPAALSLEFSGTGHRGAGRDGIQRRHR